MTSYLVTCLNYALGINEQLLKTSGADVLSSRKKIKNPWRVGGNHALTLCTSDD